jgi:hypothetical protein
MVIHHPHSLHKGVTHRWSNEIKAASPEILAHGLGFGGLSRNILDAIPRVLDWGAAHKSPDVAIEAVKFPLHLEHRLRIANGRFDLEPVAYNPGVFHQRSNFVRLVPRNSGRIKAAESLSIGFTLSQNRGPTQSSLRAFKDKELKEHAIVVLWNTPLGVVVSDHRRRRSPGAAWFVRHAQDSIRQEVYGKDADLSSEPTFNAAHLEGDEGLNFYDIPPCSFVSSVVESFFSAKGKGHAHF